MAPARKWGLAWLALTAVLAVHVWDEAAHGFISIANANIRAIRARLPFLPIPNFTLGVFVNSQMAAAAILAVLSIAAFRGRAWARFIAYPYAVLMFVNGLQHTVTSLVLRKPMPGVVSSPLLFVTSVWLYLETRRAVLSSRADG